MPQDIGFTIDRPDSAASSVASEKGKIKGSAGSNPANRNISQKTHHSQTRNNDNTPPLHYLYRQSNSRFYGIGIRSLVVYVRGVLVPVLIVRLSPDFAQSAPAYGTWTGFGLTRKISSLCPRIPFSKEHMEDQPFVKP
jgi:hypothetical protein